MSSLQTVRGPKVTTSSVGATALPALLGVPQCVLLSQRRSGTLFLRGSLPLRLTHQGLPRTLPSVATMCSSERLEDLVRELVNDLIQDELQMPEPEVRVCDLKKKLMENRRCSRAELEAFAVWAKPRKSDALPPTDAWYAQARAAVADRHENLARGLLLRKWIECRNRIAVLQRVMDEYSSAMAHHAEYISPWEEELENEMMKRKDEAKARVAALQYAVTLNTNIRLANRSAKKRLQLLRDLINVDDSSSTWFKAEDFIDDDELIEKTIAEMNQTTETE